MSFILVAADDTDVQVNGWNWRPTVNLIQRILDLDDERCDILQINGAGASVSEDEAKKIALFLDTYLVDFPADGRLLGDGSITTEPIPSGGFPDNELEKYYAATYKWLIIFRGFCHNSNGFLVR